MQIDVFNYRFIIYPINAPSEWVMRYAPEAEKVLRGFAQQRQLTGAGAWTNSLTVW